VNPPRSHQLNRLAGLAIAVLLSACGGGGGGTSEQSSILAPAVALSPAPPPAGAPSLSADPLSHAAAAILTADVPVPQPASVPAQLPWDDPVAIGYAVIPAAAPTDTGGEAPYPDLRMLPTHASR
jgi:hypothetical protein